MRILKSIFLISAMIHASSVQSAPANTLYVLQHGITAKSDTFNYMLSKGWLPAGSIVNETYETVKQGIAQQAEVLNKRDLNKYDSNAPLVFIGHSQ